MSYGVIRTDAMSGTYDGSKLVSGRFFNGSDVATAIENGNVVKIGGYVSGETEIRTLSTPAATTGINELGVVASVEVNYDATKRNLDEFRNEAGADSRVYRFVSGDVFGVTSDCIDGTAAVGKLVEAEAGTKFKAVATATASSTQIGKIIAKEEVGSLTYYVIEVA